MRSKSAAIDLLAVQAHAVALEGIKRRLMQPECLIRARAAVDYAINNGAVDQATIVEAGAFAISEYVKESC